MHNTKTILIAALFAVSSVWMISGCKQSGTAGTDEHHDGDGHEHSQGPQIANPDEAVATFLNAVRDGRHEDAAIMLTQKAREEMQNAGMHVQPPGSPEAQFSIGSVRLMPNEGGAHVDSTWTDVQRTYDITWILRQEGQTWRVAGMATQLFENEPDNKLILNFENPEEMKAQVAKAEAEIASRMQPPGGGEIRQATLPPEGQTGPLR